MKKGDRVRVITHAYDNTPDGSPNPCYGFGVTGVVDSFRNSQWHDRMAIVELDDRPGKYVDWALSWIEPA